MAISETVKDIYMGDVDVTVIIPFYRGIEWLKDALQSVNNQTKAPKEIIIIDDGSNENIPETICNELNTIVIRQENQGAANARNKAIRKASGKYIAFLDSDDIWHPQKLEIQFNIMEKADSIWSITSYSMFDDGVDGFSFEPESEPHWGIKELFPGIMCTCQIATPTVMVKRDTLIENGFFFNEQLKYGEDTCLWYSLANWSEVIIIYSKLANIRRHGSNAAGQVGVQLFARRDLWLFVQSLNVKPKNKVPKSINIVYRLCLLDCKMASVIFWEKKVLESNIYGAVFYAIPWALFKILGKKYKSFMP